MKIFFKIDKSLARPIKEKREKTQINQIILVNVKEDITANATDMQRIIKGCYEQLYANKLGNL